jgi:hypothetical protein
MKELIEEKKFEMRAYDKVELALLYCPGRSAESALKTLMRWIKQCQPLMQAWIQQGTKEREMILRRWNRLSVIWASLEKRENEVLYLCCCSYVYFRFPVYHSADCCTSLSLFMYMSFFFPVLDGGSFSTSFP